MGLRVPGDPRQHGHGLFGIPSHGRFARKHDAIGAVEDGVGDVRGLGAGGQPAMDHGLEHLRGGDDRFAGEAGPGDQPFLQNRHFLDRHLHPQIATRHHDPVGHLQNLIETFNRARPLDLGDQERTFPECRRGSPHRFDVGPGLDEGLAQRIHTLLKRELQTSPVVIGEGAHAQVDSRQVQTFPGP